GAGFPDSVSRLFSRFRPKAAMRQDRKAARRAHAPRSAGAIRTCHDRRLWFVVWTEGADRPHRGGPLATSMPERATRRSGGSGSCANGRRGRLPRAERLAAFGALTGLQVVEVELHRGVRA